MDNFSRGNLCDIIHILTAKGNRYIFFVYVLCIAFENIIFLTPAWSITDKRFADVSTDTSRNESIEDSKDFAKKATTNPTMQSNASVYGVFGIDGSPFIAIGYQTSAWIGTLRLDGSIAIPTGYMLSTPWASRYSLIGHFYLKKGQTFFIQNSIGIRIYVMDSFAWSGLSVNAEERLLVGMKRDHFYIALDGRVRPLVSTYISHSNRSKELNPGLRDGWYGEWIQGLIMGGLSGAYFLQNNLAIVGSFLYTFPIEKSLSPISPGYTDSVISISFMYYL